MLQSATFDRAKELIIIIPAAHVFLCFSYLFFYYVSFGHGVWLFSSPTDIFSVSFSTVAPGYIFLFVGVAVGHWLYSPILKQAELAASSGQPYKAPGYFKLALWGAIITGLLGAATVTLIWLRTGFVFYELLSNPIALLTGFIVGKLFSKLTPNFVTLTLALALIMAVISMTLRGLGDGQLDRAGRIATIGAERPTCGDKTILRALSADFLAAARDETRVIIDKDCKVKFTLIAASRFEARPDKAPLDLALGR